MRKFGRPFQTHVAATLIRDRSVMNRLHPVVEPDLFDDPILGDIVGAAQGHFRDSRELMTKASLRETLGGTREARLLLRDLFREDISDPQFVIAQAVEFAQRQALERAVLEQSKRITEGDTDGLIDAFRKALSVGEDMSDTGNWLHRDAQARAEQFLHPERVRRYRTGLVLLDECLGGGMEAGELGVFLAPPKTGKSFILVNVGYGLASGAEPVNVVHYSLEMNANAIHRRYAARIAGKKFNVLRDENPRQFVKELDARQRRFLGGEIVVKHYSTRGAKPSTLRAHLGQLESMGFIPGAIIVDYGDIMRAERRIGEMRHEQAGVYEDLRGIAGDYGTPLFTASQCNRGAMNKEVVTIADIAESFEKAAVADTLIGICRTDAEKASCGGRLFLAALRNNPMSKIIECHFDLANATIRTLRMGGVIESASRRGSKPYTREDADKAREDAVLAEAGG